jgi:hypothetical protein
MNPEAQVVLLVPLVKQASTEPAEQERFEKLGAALGLVQEPEVLVFQLE